jgi:hypothetical protein
LYRSRRPAGSRTAPDHWAGARGAGAAGARRGARAGGPAPRAGAGPPAPDAAPGAEGGVAAADADLVAGPGRGEEHLEGDDGGAVGGGGGGGVGVEGEGDVVGELVRCFETVEGAVLDEQLAVATWAVEAVVEEWDGEHAVGDAVLPPQPAAVLQSLHVLVLDVVANGHFQGDTD